MPLCLSEAAANTRGRLCLRPSISGRCACTVPAPRQRHSRAMPTPCPHRAHAVLAPWPLGWGRPLAVAAPTTPRSHCAARFGRGRLTRAAVAGMPVPRHARAISACFRRGIWQSLPRAPTTPRPRIARTTWLKPPIWQRPPPARLGRATPALYPHSLGCVAATAAGTRAEHTAEYRAAAVRGFPVHTM